MYALLAGAMHVKEKIKQISWTVVFSRERSFKDKVNDINNNPKDWTKTNESIKNSTKKGNKGGRSIEEEYTNKKTGDKIWKHILKDKYGRNIEKPHYRPYPKQ